jgi:hypothetical protein
MGNVKISDVNAGVRLLKRVIDKVDVNQDGAVRPTDIGKWYNEVRNADGTLPGKQGLLFDAVTVSMNVATRNGGRSVENLKAAADTLKERIKKADADGDGKLSAEEQRKVKGPETRLLNFVIAYKGKTLADIDLPTPQEPYRPRFKWSGTPAEVAQSLLESKSSPGNDNKWPDTPKSSRYVINEAEAREMLTALAPLYKSRQKAVLQELCNRSQASQFGCVSPNTAAKKLLEKSSRELGLDLDFGQPAAPRYTI